MTKYIPGVCNIGPAEQRTRFRAGLLGLAASIILIATLTFAASPQIWRLSLILPAFAAAIGFLQVYFHFCAGFGLMGIYNVVSSAGDTDDVVQSEFRRKDRAKALQIVALSFVIATIVTAAYMLI